MYDIDCIHVESETWDFDHVIQRSTLIQCHVCIIMYIVYTCISIHIHV